MNEPPCDLILIRLVTVTFTPAPAGMKKWELRVGKAEVSAVEVVEETEKSLRVMVIGAVELEHHPNVKDGLVVVPKKERREAEQGIEIAANLVALGRGCRREISSCESPVYFVPRDNAGAAWLKKQKGILRHDFQSSVGAEKQIDLSKADLVELGDRLDGVALMVEAMACEHATGRFHEFIRVFERAFAQPAKLLTQPVLKLVDPQYGYTRGEVEEWFEHIRDRATHADARPEILLESDIAPIIPRVEQAAFDVFFNKAVWRDKGTDRRDFWRPPTGTTSTDGDIFITQGAGVAMKVRVLDEFGAFSVDFRGILRNPPRAWWPQRSPSSSS